MGKIIDDLEGAELAAIVGPLLGEVVGSYQALEVVTPVDMVPGF